MTVRAALLGSGSFAIPSFQALLSSTAGVEVVQVVTQPDRPAGRGRTLEPTPVGAWAAQQGVPCVKPADVNAPEVLDTLRHARVHALAIIAFGQKIGAPLLEGRASCNLHGSLLPRWRGAAPIQRSVIANDAQVGVSVIGIVERMDAGLVYATAAATVGPSETSGDVHDRLAHLGVPAMVTTLVDLAQGRATGVVQDESLATRAKKLSRADAWVDFTQPAAQVRARINGLSPWPGTDAVLHHAEGRTPIKLLRSQEVTGDAPMGSVDAAGGVGCGSGMVKVIEAQLPGGKVLALADLLRGRRWTDLRLESGPHAADR